MSTSPWLYYRLYVESGSAGIEYLIRHVLPEILQVVDFDRWFFVRYRDAKGLHMRLRLRTPRNQLRRTQLVLPSLLSSGLQQARRATAVNTTVPHGISTATLWEGDDYEPETGHFGVRGIEIAEQVFQVSSDIAVTVLSREYQRACSRNVIAPVLMNAVAEAFVDNEPHRAFWDRYMSYWLRDLAHNESQALRAKFESKAAAGAYALPALDDWDAELRSAITAWRCGLTRARREFNGLQELQAMRPAYLAFHFIHLMNNRLGILPLQEAYFASLLQSDASGGMQ